MAMSGALVSDPSQLAGLFSQNNPIGMGSGAGSGATMQGAPVLGGVNNPFAYSATAATGPSGGSFGTAYGDPTNFMGGGGAGTGGIAMPNIAGAATTPTPGHGVNVDLAKSFQKAGYPSGVGTAMAEFLQGGAGFNPQIAQWLIQSMQPQFAEGQANLMEQFGTTGGAAGSGSQLGLAGYEAQTNAAIGGLLSQMYEQSVSNYMNMLMGGSFKAGGGQQQSPFMSAFESQLGKTLGGGGINIGMQF